MEVGITILKTYAPKHSAQLLSVLQSFINKVKGVSNIVFLGVLAPFLENSSSFNMVEKRISELFVGDHQAEQRAISKCMVDLMSFFKEPLKKVEEVLKTM